MTIAPDYPDYQSYANWRGPDLNAASAWDLTASNPFTATGYVTNYASVVIEIESAPANGMTVVVQFYTDNTETVFVGGYEWNLAPTQELTVTIPALGNYCSVNMTTTTIGTNAINIAVVPTSTVTAAPSYSNDTNYVSGFDVSIPSGTTESYLLTFVSSGRCSIHFQDLAASGKVSAFLWTASVAGGRQDRIYNSNNATGVIDVSLTVPAVPLLLQVDNTDTVAHSVDYYCCVDGRL